MNIIEKQPIFNKILEKAILKSNYAQAYILVGNNIEYVKSKAILLAKAFICPLEYKDNCCDCNICRRIDNNNFGELKIIDPVNKIIKKEKIVNIKKSFSTDSIEGKNQVYIIDEIELLNQSAANSILKFLEEPDSNTIAIFTTTNVDSVMKTILSRCQIVRLFDTIKTDNKNKIYEFCGFNIEETNIVINYFIDMEKNLNDALITLKERIINKFNSKESINSVLKLFLLIYEDILNYKLLGKFDFFDDYSSIAEISSSQNVEKVIKKVSFVLENMKKIEYNINIPLFMNNLIIGIGEISNDKCSRS